MADGFQPQGPPFFKTTNKTPFNVLPSKTPKIKYKNDVKIEGQGLFHPFWEKAPGLNWGKNMQHFF